MMEIPEIVRTQLALHAATAAHELARVRDQLTGEGVTTSVSRRLRSRRERLAAELEAWQYLVRHTNGLNVRTQLEKIHPSEVTSTPAGIEPAECERCGHSHVKGARCGCALGESDPRLFCECTS